MKPLISVVICTHNPNLDYLNKAIQALKNQTFPLEKWELLIVDNASNSNWFSEINLSWHPNFHYFLEKQLGVTYARLKGMQECNADLLLFVDDDNILDANYLEKVLQISDAYPQLGVWGGQSIAEFEVVPPEWTKPYWVWLAIREFDHDQVSSEFSTKVHVITAGGCYRRKVFEAYLRLASQDYRRGLLGQKGSKLLRREDIDLCYSAYDVNLGVGLFKDLKLKHLIPLSRFRENYLIQLVAGDKYSELLLLYIRCKMKKLKYWKHLLRLTLRSAPWIIEPRTWIMPPRQRRFRIAERKASLEAMIAIFRLQQVDKTMEKN